MADVPQGAVRESFGARELGTNPGELTRVFEGTTEVNYFHKEKGAIILSPQNLSQGDKVLKGRGYESSGFGAFEAGFEDRNPPEDPRFKEFYDAGKKAGDTMEAVCG